MEEPLENIKEGGKALSEIIKIAGDDPKVKEATSNLGQTAVTVTKAINNVLLPLAAVNFAFDKAKQYFDNKFQEDLAARTSTIPPEDITEPKASVAGPALQGLSFTHEEPDLKDLYLNLLSSSMDRRVAEDAHPAFVEIIRQLNSEEAFLLKDLIKQKAAPIVELHGREGEKSGYKVLKTHLLDIRNSDDNAKLEESPKLAAMIDNFVRLGLINVDYSKHLTSPNAYDWVEERPEYQKWIQNKPDSIKIEIEKGLLERTSLGVQFAKACGLI